ncbi:MAG TPA: hypothetical protein VF614_02095 [Chthoniobacteraceae bacterium]|jgi:hypothetical protein
MNTAQPVRYRGAVRCYLAGLVLLSSTVILTDALNPRGVRNGSWFDAYSLPLALISLSLIVLAPFLSRRPLGQQVGYLIAGLVGGLLAVVASWLFTARVFGAIPDLVSFAH